MSYTDYADDTTGNTLYAKPEPLTSSPSWGADKVSGTENGSTGSYAFTLDSTLAYVVYRQAGGSPASTDVKLGRFGKNLELDIKAKTDLITSAGVVHAEESSTTIRLKTGSTKAKTVTVEENLTGKTLKLFAATMDNAYFAEFSITAGNGSFAFTPSTALVEKNRDFKYSVREPSDGNNVLYDGLLQVGFAADDEE